MELTLPSKRSRNFDDAVTDTATLRRLNRSAWNRTDVGITGLERIIDVQALKINDLEKGLNDLKEKSQRNEWASRELGRIMESNAKWKEHCDELQTRLRSEGKTRLRREHELQLKIAESEQQVTALLHAQSDQQMELTAVKTRLVTAQAQLEGATLQQWNSDRMQGTQPVDTSRELLSARASLSTLRKELHKTRARMAGIETELVQATEKLSKHDIEIDTQQRHQELLQSKLRALECDAAEASAAKTELMEARKQIQKLLEQTSQADDQEQLKERLRITQAASQAQQVKLEAMAEEQYRNINWDSERNELQAEISNLQHALNDLQSATGVQDVRHVLQGYQTREVQLEQKVQQLMTELQHLKHKSQSMSTEVASVQDERNELARTAQAATSQVESLVAGHALLQKEVDFLNDRLKLHMTAFTSLTEQEIPAMSKPEQFSELCLALKETKAAQARLLQQNKKMEGDCQAAHQAKVVVRQELRATQKILQEIKAQAKDDSLKHKKALAQQSSQDAQPEDTHSSVRREYLEHQLEVVLSENEQLRTECRELHTQLCGSSPNNATDDKASLLQQAELTVAKQTVEDYRTRLDKLGQFFVQNSEQFRMAVQALLGWNVVLRKQVGDSCSGVVELSLRSGKGKVHHLKVSMDDVNKYSLTEIPAWVHHIDEHDGVVKEYNSHRSLPRLLASVLLAEATPQEPSK